MVSRTDALCQVFSGYHQSFIEPIGPIHAVGLNATSLCLLLACCFLQLVNANGSLFASL